MTDHHRDRLRMGALIDALPEDEPVDPVGEGRRFLLAHLDEQVRHAIHDERDPMLEQIEENDEWFRRESRDFDR